MTVSLSFVIPSTGRPTLINTLHSITTQTQPGDQILVDINQDGDYGNGARNRTMLRATSSHIAFIDDDDIYLPGALDRIRATVSQEPGRVHMFRMEYAGGWHPILWEIPEVKIRNVGTQNIIVPNQPDRLGYWGSEHVYEGDYDFIRSTCERFGDPVWVDDITVLYRPNG